MITNKVATNIQAVSPLFGTGAGAAGAAGVDAADSAATTGADAALASVVDTAGALATMLADAALAAEALTSSAQVKLAWVIANVIASTLNIFEKVFIIISLLFA